MARFFEMPLPGEKGHTAIVNLDRINYMWPQSDLPGRTMLYFAGEQSLVDMDDKIVSASIQK
ncbi:MAG: hypothetical protein QOH67_2274 [Hyphomicrobiales bacterium]|jgi:hypothetical protein|nr:hypothetical protein [Hyphomicrobiales bacterium]